MSVLAALWAGALGVPVGAFVNVVVERVPERLPLRASTPGELNPPRRWLGVPVQPWLLRGRGSGHRRLRWLFVELATAAVFAAIGARFGTTSVMVPLLVMGAGLVAVSVVDLELLRIPDRITFPTLGLCAVTMVIASVERSATGALSGAVLGAFAYFVLLLLAHLVSPRGMGFGDVKLALLMGLVLGWLGWDPDEAVLGPLRLVLRALVFGSIFGVVFGVTHQVITRRRGEFPFGPSLALGCLLVVLTVS